MLRRASGRDAVDFARHVECFWWNRVRHGLAGRVADWPYSTFHRDVRRGVVTADWGGGEAVGASGAAGPGMVGSTPYLLRNFDLGRVEEAFGRKGGKLFGFSVVT